MSICFQNAIKVSFVIHYWSLYNKEVLDIVTLYNSQCLLAMWTLCYKMAASVDKNTQEKITLISLILDGFWNLNSQIDVVFFSSESNGIITFFSQCLV